jgi:hypothetical protein
MRLSFLGSFGRPFVEHDSAVTQRVVVGDRFAEAHELDAEVPEQIEALDEVAHAAAEAVERGDNHHVHFSDFHDGEEPIEAGAAILGSRHALVEVLGRLPPAGRDVLAEVVPLRLARLVGR